MVFSKFNNIKEIKMHDLSQQIDDLYSEISALSPSDKAIIARKLIYLVTIMIVQNKLEACFEIMHEIGKIAKRSEIDISAEATELAINISRLSDEDFQKIIQKLRKHLPLKNSTLQNYFATWLDVRTEEIFNIEKYRKAHEQNLPLILEEVNYEDFKFRIEREKADQSAFQAMIIDYFQKKDYLTYVSEYDVVIAKNEQEKEWFCASISIGEDVKISVIKL